MRQGAEQEVARARGRSPWIVTLTEEAGGVRPMTEPPHRLAAITSHAMEERGAFFRALADHPRVDLRVFAVGGGGLWRVVNLDIVRALLRGRYDAILLERYGHITALLAYLAARISRTAIFLRLGPGAIPPRLVVARWLHRLARRPLLRRTDGVLVSGGRQGWLQEHHELPAERVFRTPAAVEASVSRMVDALDCVGRRRVAWRHEDPRWVAERDDRSRWGTVGEPEGSA